MTPLELSAKIRISEDSIKQYIDRHRQRRGTVPAAGYMMTKRQSIVVALGLLMGLDASWASNEYIRAMQHIKGDKA